MSLVPPKEGRVSPVKGFREGERLLKAVLYQKNDFCKADKTLQRGAIACYGMVLYLKKAFIKRYFVWG